MNRVIAGIPPTEPRSEMVIWAATEAAARGARLDLVTACPPPPGTDRNGAAHAASAWAARLATEYQPDLRVIARLVQGPPEEVLRAEGVGADLLVIGADDQNPFMEAIVGSVPGALLTTAACPIVVVPKGAEPAPKAAPVLVGVDTAETSRAALDYAFASADRGGQPLDVVLCYTPPRDRVGRRASFADARRSLAEALSGFAEQYPNVAVTELFVDGDPIEELARRSRKAALLVLGSRGRGRLASMAFGSVSRSLIRRSHCPVAVLPVLATVAG
jgi:nucleotide-binding universal stress UspA family protein